MRDPKRIDTIIGLLRSYWHTNPDLRLGQIISNLTPDRFGLDTVCGPVADPFSVEDTEWEDILRTQLRKIAKEQK